MLISTVSEQKILICAKLQLYNLFHQLETVVVELGNHIVPEAEHCNYVTKKFFFHLQHLVCTAQNVSFDITK
ncbi:hypothetical protein T10_7150 [Trichinella papuae]|uniref:Uncharacterized protein n=1 Tax=Trichinella papuae TaxID=268474 RepID=A0A0V1MTV6_9BILA|nr:hypothetical protein T10_7150 [Trichinella papuae]